VPTGSYRFLGDAIEPLVGDVPAGGRFALVACGSNAAPVQLQRKFADHDVDPEMVVARATIAGAASVYSCHVSRYGAIPATLMGRPGASTDLFVLFVDADQLRVLEASERRSYQLVALDPEVHPVTLASGERVERPWCFASTFGALVLDNTPIGLAAFPTTGLDALTHAELWTELGRRWQLQHPHLPTDPAAIIELLGGDVEAARPVRDAFDAVASSCDLGLAIDARAIEVFPA
jgi:hypothetical protein